MLGLFIFSLYYATMSDNSQPKTEGNTGTTTSTVTMTASTSSEPLNSSSNQSIYAYNAKLPTFWTNAPEAYFETIEASFELYRITLSRTKYHHLVVALPVNVATDSLRVMKACATSATPYEDLKAALIANYTQSETDRLEDLLSQAEMGDKTPRQFYNSLSNTAGRNFHDEDSLLRKLWMRRLPVEIQLPLKPFENDTLETLLKVADGLHEVQKRNRHVSSVRADEPLISKQCDLEAKIAQLTSQLAQMSSGRSRLPSRSKSRNRSHSRNRNGSKVSDVCWYHEQHGKHARKCREPCKYSQQFNVPKN